MKSGLSTPLVKNLSPCFRRCLGYAEGLHVFDGTQHPQHEGCSLRCLVYYLLGVHMGFLTAKFSLLWRYNNECEITSVILPAWGLA